MNIFFIFYFICVFIFYFFFNDTSTTEIYTLSLHDALPISPLTFSTALATPLPIQSVPPSRSSVASNSPVEAPEGTARSEEHTSELQSRFDLVCRLLLEKKNT